MSERSASTGADAALEAFAALGAAQDADVWSTLARWRDEGRTLALLSVTETRGFTPRKPGARMLLRDDGVTCGTIGGGAVERAALESARALMCRGGHAETLHWHLTQELGMCCGGEMSVHVEVVEPKPRLTVFGGGHIGRALAALALGCGFEVTVVDERPEWTDAASAGGAVMVCRDGETYLREAPPDPGSYVVVVTHDHRLDQRLVEMLLERPPRFLGLVGSLPKQRKFALRLRARGFDDAAIARVKAPLGVAIGAATPEEIAVSVMAELIAVRRGVVIGPPDAPPARQGTRATAAPMTRAKDAAPALREDTT